MTLAPTTQPCEAELPGQLTYFVAAGTVQVDAARLDDAKLGAPTQTIGSVSLYSYTSTSNERKVMAGYFKADRLLHFPRFVLKDGKNIDEIAKTAAKIPCAKTGSVEIVPFMEM